MPAGMSSLQPPDQGLRRPTIAFRGLTILSPYMKISNGTTIEEEDPIIMHDRIETISNGNQHTCHSANCCFNDDGTRVCKQTSTGELYNHVVYHNQDSEGGIPIGHGFQQFGQINNVCIKQLGSQKCWRKLLKVILVRWCDGTVGAVFKNKNGYYLRM